MHQDAASPAEQAIVLQSLIAYADACVRPRLTPGCPYYKVQDDGPTCGMECRTAIERLGGPEPQVRTVNVGGLRMTGLALPLAVAAGEQPYDAGQLFVEERLHEPSAQSTSTLLLGLRAALRLPVMGDTSNRPEKSLTLWGELVRRGVPVEGVVREALLGDMAVHIALHAATPYFVAADALPRDLSNELRGKALDRAGTGWSAVLRDVAATWPDPEAMLADILREPPMSSLLLLDALPQRAPWDHREAPPNDAVQKAAAVPEIRLAFSPLFLRRVQDWLSRTLADDLMAALRADPPPPAVLLALPARTHDRPRDEVNFWIWERLTSSRTAAWTTSSLTMEWRHLNGQAPPDACDPRLLAERDTDPQDISELLLDRLSSRSIRRPAPQGLTASALTGKAIDLLLDNRPQAAADVFEGLIALRPADGDAWNNYGFCLMPIDPERALGALQQSSLYQRDEPFINVANRALSLHLAGRDDDAVAVAVAVAGLATVEPGTAMSTAALWHHWPGSVALTLFTDQDPHQYLMRLLTHIRAGGCRPSAP